MILLKGDMNFASGTNLKAQLIYTRRDNVSMVNGTGHLNIPGVMDDGSISVDVYPRFNFYYFVCDCMIIIF